MIYQPVATSNRNGLLINQYRHDRQFMQIILYGHKINAIKYLKDMERDLGLQETREIVEFLQLESLTS